MTKKVKGDDKMTTLKLKEIETRAVRNTTKYQPIINKVTSRIQNQGLECGRVRPKDPSEARILSRFSNK